ncbi:MAG: hypothetical protein JSV79_09980 [Armatimonadota bacterium]|nr:MAG: hypothetical protein JSV79_09980 [Armatimonadota bacterium]
MPTTGRATATRRACVAIIALSGALIAVCLLPGRPASALRLPTGEPGLRVRVHVQWNQQYLSLAAKVPDLMVTGSSTAPMSAPEQDDAIEFSFETPTQAGPSPAYRLIISAAGGMTLLARDAGGRWRPDNSWTAGPRTIKYVVQVDATLNDPTDEDGGFVVECAIPWEFLHGAPIDGPDLGFNVVSWMQGESEGLASWAPTVQQPADVGSSLRWGRMRISTSAALAKAQGAWIPCPYVGATPLIDGKLAANEWLAASTLEFDKPKPSLVQPRPPAQRTGVMPTLLAVYRYDWRWNPGPNQGTPFWAPDGAPATADQPMEGAGPWYTSERVDWHSTQLEAIQRAGIDVILPVYRGDEDSRRSWARPGLDYLTEALKRRRAQGKSYPLVGMLLDTTSLHGANLKSDEGKRRLYAMIRDFFLHVSPEFWAELPSPADDRAAVVPLLLGEPDGLSDWDGGFLDYCRRRFAEDFGGARLAWLGSPAWGSRGADDFYAHVRLAAATSFAQEAPGAASAAALSPGHCPPPGASGEIRPRREGRAYRGAWQRALAAKPDLLVIDSWNDFASGTEIAPSRQYGVAYVDATKYFKARLGSQQPHQLRLKKRALPPALRPGADYLVELLVENLGTEDVQTGRRVTADYHIARQSDGRVVQQKIAAQSLSILAGQTKRLPVVISIKDDAGKPLPPGDYLFSLSVVKSKIAYLRSRWFARTLAELAIPITVADPPARRATILSTSLPSAIEWGATEQVVVRLRNDGAATWRKGNTFLTYRWLPEQHNEDAAISQGGTSRPLRNADTRADLPQDVGRGEVVSVLIPVTATEEQGAIGPTSPHDRPACRIQWDLVEDGSPSFSEVGAPLPDEAIQVVAKAGVVYESVEGPRTMEAGERADFSLALRNRGYQVWAAEESFVRYTWHRWDGREVLPGRASHVLQNVPPGGTAELAVPVDAPRLPGPYWLTWQVMVNGRSADACRHAPPVLPVMVRSSKMHALDLSSFMNVAAVTTDSRRAQGDLDGAGRSLPAEWLPPDQSAPGNGVYPSGYYTSHAPYTVPFAFPDTRSGTGGAVACVGQSIPLGDRPAARVHLLAAATADSRPAAFGLKGRTGETSQLTVTVPSWAQRDDAVIIGAYAPYTRTITGDDASVPAYLYHLTLSAGSPAAVSLELPQAPEIKILAITVETE